MNLCICHICGTGVPVKSGNGSLLGGEVLKTILFRGHLVPTLELGHFHLPLPGGGGGASVNVDVDGVAAGGGRDEHVLSGVVAANGRRRSVAGADHAELIVHAFA